MEEFNGKWTEIIDIQILIADKMVEYIDLNYWNDHFLIFNRYVVNIL